MKIKFFLVLLITTEITFYTFAQVNTAWVRRFNGPLNASDAGTIIKVDEDGFVFLGCSISKTPGFSDAAVIKYTPNGDTLWVRYFNNQFNNGGILRDMQIDNNGHIIITGQCAGPNLSDYFTMKLDSDGNTLWSERFDKGDMDAALAMVVDDNQNIFITGTSWKLFQSQNILTIKYSPYGDTLWTYMWAGNEDAFDLGKDIELDSYGNVLVAGETDWYWGTSDYVTIKLNPAGDTAWVRKYDSPEHASDILKALVVDNRDNIYVTGDVYKSGGNHDIITIKYNLSGDTIWTRRYNGAGNGDDKVYAMTVDSAGNIYLAGSSFVSGNGIDCLTMKYNSDGVLMWVNTYAEYSYYADGATSIALDKSGNVYVTGSAATSSSNVAYLTIKYDNDGNEKWVAKYDGLGYNGYDISNSVFVDNSGYVYITGSSPGVLSGNDIATIKYIQPPNNVDNNSGDQPAKFELFQNYPNPFNPSTIINWQSPISGKQTIKLFDVLGREIETIVDGYYEAGNHSTLYIPNSTLSSGVYFYQLKAGDFVQTKKMVLIR